MQSGMHVVYREQAGSFVSLIKSPANSVDVIVREWSADYVVEYTVFVSVTTNNKSVNRKEIVDGNLAEAVRRGIDIFEFEVGIHPVLHKV